MECFRNWCMAFGCGYYVGEPVEVAYMFGLGLLLVYYDLVV